MVIKSLIKARVDKQRNCLEESLQSGGIYNITNITCHSLQIVTTLKIYHTELRAPEHIWALSMDAAKGMKEKGWQHLPVSFGLLTPHICHVPSLHLQTLKNTPASPPRNLLIFRFSSELHQPTFEMKAKAKWDEKRAMIQRALSNQPWQSVTCPQHTLFPVTWRTSPSFPKAEAMYFSCWGIMTSLCV